uniref:Uncharacterized protein n=1 Tax=Lepeophtheirus salmonis TaxID=72036 RepID=A0A0K2TPM4_LEPSM
MLTRQNFFHSIWPPSFSITAFTRLQKAMQDLMTPSSNKFSNAATIENFGESTFGCEFLLGSLSKVPIYESPVVSNLVRKGGIFL